MRTLPISPGATMRICVYGAGAVGGHVAVKLAAAGQDVSVVARGPHLEAIRRDGLVLRAGDRELRHRVRASDDPAELGRQDLVISTVKATGLAALAEGIAPLLGPDTPVVFALNGVPWWFSLNGGDALAGVAARLDPGGALARALGEARTLGCVINSSNSVIAPGVVLNESPQRNRLAVGEIDDRASERASAIRDVLRRAGFDSPDIPSVRREVWSKLGLNISASVMALLTQSASSIVREDPEVGAVAKSLMREIVALAAAYAADIAADFADPDALVARAPARRPSILQDYQQGRPMEVDAMLLAPRDLARAAGVHAPTLEVIAALAGALAAYRAVAA